MNWTEVRQGSSLPAPMFMTLYSKTEQEKDPRSTI